MPYLVSYITDFYLIQKDPSDKMGVPAGVAQNCVLKVFKKWEMQARQDSEYYSKKRMASDGNIPPAGQEVEVTSKVLEEAEKPKSRKDDETGTQERAELEKKDVPQGEINAGQNNAHKMNNCKQPGVQIAGDSYNGAVLDNYRWSQSLVDLDIQVPVPEYVTKAHDVRVNITATTLSVAVKGKEAGEWKTLMDGELCQRTNKHESIWNLEPGRCIQVYLQKSIENWWDALLMSEEKIDLSNIDATNPINDLAEDEQMKIQEFMWNQDRRRQGLPTSDQLATEKILKEAWNKEGSPFLGTEYDPSVVNFGNSCTDLPEDFRDLP
ncbi:NudC domain-containing protein 3 [Cryptotermes secundus]|uniref:NudC domain-containing protein 3 n=1 Tax=Cryptotermes secundus TaxID=105785 RepID=A0A2J7QN10_9NEOP|nr:nudC domain-containing protein 3 isoform X2 [Cryptotermes secundus]PNF29974.1 NudC domain-containing protein 3 [Cryptotermes secundus]